MLPSQQKFNENGPNILIHKGLVWSKKFYALVFEKKKTTNQNAKMKWFSILFQVQHIVSSGGIDLSGT